MAATRRPAKSRSICASRSARSPADRTGRTDGAADALQHARALGGVGRQHLRDRGERPRLVEHQAEVLLAQDLLERLQRQAVVLGADLAQRVEGALVDARPGHADVDQRPDRRLARDRPRRRPPSARRCAAGSGRRAPGSMPGRGRGASSVGPTPTIACSTGEP